MPKKSQSRPVESNNDPYQWIDAAVVNATKTLRVRRSGEYDGVQGSLPPWVPGNFQKEFNAARNRLLDNCGYSADQLLNLIAQEMGSYRYALRSPEKPVSYGGFLWPPAVAKDVSLLAHIKTAVRLGPEKGLAFLTDPSHAGKITKGERYGRHQSRIAKHPRGKINESGITVNQIIGRLARRDDERVKDLWSEFYGLLRECLLDPKWIDGGIEYNYKKRRKSISFGRFSNIVSATRSKKSR